MEDNEIDIFVQTEDGKKFPMEVCKEIKYLVLREKIKNLILKDNHFYISYNSKKYDKENLNEILFLNKGDIIYTIVTIVKEKHTKVKFHININLNEADMKIEKLSGILQICLLEFIAKKIDNIKKIKNDEIREIISELKKEMDLTNNPEEDIKQILVKNLEIIL